MAPRMIFIVQFTGHSRPCSIRSSSSSPPLSASFLLCESVHVHSHTRHTHINSLDHKLLVKQDFPTTVSPGLNQCLPVCSHLIETEALDVHLCFNVRNGLICSSFFSFLLLEAGALTHHKCACPSMFTSLLIPGVLPD